MSTKEYSKVFLVFIGFGSEFDESSIAYSVEKNMEVIFFLIRLIEKD